MFEGGSGDVALLPPRLETLVREEIEDNEHILWLAQPMAGRFARGTLPLVAFGVFWMGFVIWFTISWYSHGGDKSIGSILFDVPFFVVGIGMLCSPLWAIWKAKRTVYVITDQRAIVFEGGLSTKVRTFKPDHFANIERRQRRDGSGDIVFEHRAVQGGEGQSAWPVGFLAIANVKEVEDLLREVAQAHEAREHQQEQ